MTLSESGNFISEANSAKGVEKNNAVKGKKVPNELVYTKAMLEDLVKAKKMAEDKKLITGSDPSQLSSNHIPIVQWVIKDKSIVAVPQPSSNTMTYINYEGSIAKAPDIINFLGMKLDFSGRVNHFKGEFKKNYILARSHNLLLSRFAALKVGFYGMLLSFLGTTPEEIESMQKEAREAAITQNIKLFEENESSNEMIEIFGGNRKKVRSEKMVVAEIRKQLLMQAEKLGMKDYYSEEKINEIQSDQCGKIENKLSEELSSLNYQLSMFDMGFAGEQSESEIKSKIFKMSGFVSKAQGRMNYHSKNRSKLAGKRMFGAIPKGLS